MEIRQDGGQITRMGENETGSRTKRSPHLTSNDVCNGSLPQPGGTIEDRVIERFVPLLRRLDTDPQRFFHPLLANIFFQGLRTQTLRVLYSTPWAYAQFGYEGEAFSKGGYLFRGFNDLRWLPEVPESDSGPVPAR